MNDKKHGNMKSWLTLFVGALITLSVAWGLNYQNEHQLKVYTNNLADKTESLIEQRFLHFEYGLRGMRGAIVTSGIDDITRQQLDNYGDSRDIKNEFPGALGFGFIRRISIGEEASFITKVRAGWFPDFTIRALTPHDGDRFVIQYVSSLRNNFKAVGLDIGSEKNRRNAAISAARDDRPKLTAPITLVQSSKKTRRGALILLPIYSGNVSLNTPKDRENAVVGWSYAPLIIDDVLANLDTLIDSSSVTLTNLAETEPFYSSGNSVSTNLSNTLVRNVFILGQHWKMELTPSAQAIGTLNPWNIGWVIVFGLGFTLCSLLVINIFRTDPFNEEQALKNYKVGLQSLTAFVNSQRFKQSRLFILFLVLLMLTVSSWLVVHNYFHEVRQQLLDAKELTLSTLNEESTHYRRDTLFLAQTPPIKALKSLSFNTTSIEDSDSLSLQWEERASDIFKAYMLSNSGVYQIRLITARNDWKEIVKVQRSGNELGVLSKEALQSKKNEPYIEQTLNAGVGNVFESDINLNREFGKIEQPNHAVWRFSTPLLYPDGRPFGIIIVNVSADHLLASSVSDAPGDVKVYITNTESDFLLHPNTSKMFTFEYGNPYRWQDEFKPLSGLYALSCFGLPCYEGLEDNLIVDQASFILKGGADNRLLKIYSTTSQFSVLKKIAFEVGSIAIVLFLISLFGVFIQYWLWLSEKVRQRDITNAQIEDQRNKETQRFKGLLESAPDATLVFDEVGVIQIVNAQTEQMFGYGRLELEGQFIHKLIPAYIEDGLQINITDYVQQSQKRTIGTNEALFALQADGNKFPVEISLSAIHFDAKILISAAVRNISERLAIEGKLRSALNDAEVATQAKSAFLANTSHEIRTPLNAIIGLGYLLAEEKLTEEQHRLVSKIQISGKSLLGIVNDVLDLSKIEANEVEFEAHPIELRDFFEEVSSVFAIQAEAKNLEFSLKLHSDLPTWVVTDSVRLRQIAVNLLSNALKFTAVGNISISVEIHTSDKVLPENHICIRVIVKDTGIGISPEAQVHLFKPFTQADSSTTRKFGGTGLGLSIVSQLVNMMGGEIVLESTKSVGSQFIVDLPLRVQTIEENADLENHEQTLFVLIAEDNPADAEQLKKMTRALGWRAEIVSNGQELVDTYIKRKENKLRPPDAMIVDWQMPVINGVDAVNILANQVGRENLPAILMVSSYDKNNIVSNNAEHCISRFLLKPVSASALFNAVNDIVTLNTGNSKRVLQSTDKEAVGAKWLPNLRILVVDDSLTNLVVVSHVLKHNGAEVKTATNGEDALILLEESPDYFDAVLMDVQMPGIDGLETTQRARNYLELTSLPIIALTAGALLEEKTRALEAGMDDFLTKPINPSKLINVLRKLVENYRGQEIPIESLSSESTKQDSWPMIKGLNSSKAKNLLLGDEQLFLGTLDSLLNEHTNLVAPFDVDLDDQNSKDLRTQFASQIHRLKSTAGMVGADNIQKLAFDAENLLRSDAAPVKEIMTALSIALQKLQKESKDVLDAWKKEKNDVIESIVDAPLLELETVEDILRLLSEQDLDALERVDEHNASLRRSLGNENFSQLQESLAKLHYQDAIALLSPLIKTFGV